jgi:hypothetical protein
MKIFNACVIVAIRALTGNNHWEPQELIDEIVEYNGLPPQTVHKLGKYADVKVWEDGTDISANDSGATISHNGKVKRLRGNDKVAVGYATRGGNGAHMETVRADQLAHVMNSHEIAYVITNNDDIQEKSFACPICIGECTH